MTTKDIMNKGADFWRLTLGANVIPADSKSKSTRIPWTPWQKNPIPIEMHNEWKRNGDFSKGLAVIPGKVYHRTEKKGLFLTCIEWDRPLGFTELFSEGVTRSHEQASMEHYIEKHLDDPDKGHLWIYTPFMFPKKNADPVLGIEVRGAGEHGIIMSSPSIHKNGHRYEAVGVVEPVTYTEDRASELLLHLDKVCRKYELTYLSRDSNGPGRSRSTLPNRIKTMLKNVEIDYAMEIGDGQRHQTMIVVANSLLFRHSRTRNHERLKEFFMNVNNEVCKPPISDREALRIWDDALEYVSKTQGTEQRQQYSATENDSGRHDSLPWLPDNIRQLLSHHKWAFKRYSSPTTLIVAHSKLNQIIEERLEGRDVKQQTGPDLRTYFLRPRDIILNAIPIEVTKYEDPINRIQEHRYKIRFRTSIGTTFTMNDPSTLDTIINELSARALVYSVPGAKESLAAIINAFVEDGTIKISGEIESPGFYLIDGKIKAFGMIIKDHSQEEFRESALYLTELVEKHHRKEIPATTLKWATMAPMDFVLKQYTNDLCWIPWMGLVGWPRSGKGTQGRIACGVWGGFQGHDHKRNYLPFTTVNTEARLGKKLSESTLPLTFNECDVLNDEKFRNMLEMIKNCIETRISRGRYVSRTIFSDEPALSACILTSNSPLPSDLGFRSRIIYIVYDQNDRFWNQEEEKKFSGFLNKGSRYLRVYGDFVGRHVLENQNVLLREKPEDCDWRETAELVLKEFYAAADLPAPEWVTLFFEAGNVTVAAVQEAGEFSHFELRGFFEKVINESYRIDPGVNDSGLRLEASFQEKLDRCLNKRLIPYLHKHLNRSGICEIAITHDIIYYLKRNKISNMSTMQALATAIPGFEYGNLKLNGKSPRVVHGPYYDFINFLNSVFNEEKRPNVSD